MEPEKADEGPDKKPKQSWYEANKEQVKLIQFLLYHLKKHETKTPKQENEEFKNASAHFTLRFD